MKCTDKSGILRRTLSVFMKNIFLALAVSVVPIQAQAQTGAIHLKSAQDILLSLPQKTTTGVFLPDEQSQNSEFDQTPTGKWRRDVRTFRKESPKLSNLQNATRWLGLSQSRLKLPIQDPTTGMPRPEFGELVRALPEPKNWPTLLETAFGNQVQVPTKENAAISYFAARLMDEPDAQAEALHSLHRLMLPVYHKVLQAAPRFTSNTAQNRSSSEWIKQKQSWDTSVNELIDFTSLLSDSPSSAHKVLSVQWQLKLIPLQRENQAYRVPDLVAQLGEPTATALLRKILESSTPTEWFQAGKTRDLARKIWLSTPALQTKSQWDLANSSHDWKFSRAMLDKFARPGTKLDQNTLFSARSVVLDGLVNTNQFTLATQNLERWLKPQATSGASKNSEEQISSPFIPDELPRAQQMKQLNWLEATLKRHPELPWWSSYVTFSRQLGQTPRCFQFLKVMGSHPSVAKGATYRRYLLALSATYLDLNEVQNGGNALVRALQWSVQTKAPAEIYQDVDSLLQLCELFPHLQWLQAARNGTRVLFNPSLNAEQNGVSETKHATLALRFARQNQVVFGQNLLLGKLQAIYSERLKDHYFGDDSEKKRAYLYGLMAIYHQVNRPHDALYLLQNATGWGQKELTPLLTYQGQQSWYEDLDTPKVKQLPRLGYLAAWALAETNQRDKATTVIRALLERKTGYDAAYRLLCDLQGEAARLFLQKLASIDHFEERPLIWQAYLSRKRKNYSEAQKLAEQAIAIDPSDGEQGQGDRLRAYSELGAALRSQNKTAQAQKIEAAVGAIRLSEKADLYRIVGLDSRAIALYRQSLRYFDNAYCVQSRLAVELTSLGHYDQASQHFRRAYELMPDSFGRLESHCFGCEGVFGGKEQNSLARTVFLKLEKARPNDAKIAYLSGYWRQTSGMAKEAVHYYERAVKLDPNYLSAWKKLTELPDSLTPQQIDRATLNLIRLDPGGHHDGYGVSFEMKGNYWGLWKMTQAVLPRNAPQSKANFLLKSAPDEFEWNDYDTWALVRKPADAIACQPFVRHVAGLL